MELYQVIKKPVVSEKSVKLEGANQYTFLVNIDTNKVEVARAIEKIYKVKVDSVNIINVRKKVRALGGGKEMTKRKAGKHAIVNLKKGEKLDLAKINV